MGSPLDLFFFMRLQVIDCYHVSLLSMPHWRFDHKLSEMLLKSRWSLGGDRHRDRLRVPPRRTGRHLVHLMFIDWDNSKSLGQGGIT